MNSCDAMRRLADAWKRVRPADSIILLDLPATADDAAVAYFAGELARLTESLSEWSGRNIAYARAYWQAAAPECKRFIMKR
jgi:benzoyl-CoA reductase/2-hydroxyglutaryl-CoA dehydratase subunit BcrC/BadD/HgdB